MAVGRNCCLRKMICFTKKKVQCIRNYLKWTPWEKTNHRKIGFSHLPSDSKVPHKKLVWEDLQHITAKVYPSSASKFRVYWSKDRLVWLTHRNETNKEISQHHLILLQVWAKLATCLNSRCYYYTLPPHLLKPKHLRPPMHTLFLALVCRSFFLSLKEISRACRMSHN